MQQTTLEEELLDCYRRLSQENKRQALAAMNAITGQGEKAGAAADGLTTCERRNGSAGAEWAPCAVPGNDRLRR
jgi:hypothetical protein